MELKLIIRNLKTARTISSNRTFMELKYTIHLWDNEIRRF